MTERVLGCILAGGLARRMGGGDKGLIRLDGKPILDHVIERLDRQTAAAVINANGDPARFASYGVPVVADPVEGFVGPLAGVLAGMLTARDQGFPWAVTVATDTPFFPRDLVARLLASAQGNDMACAASGGRRHPVIGLWPARLADDLRKALVDDGIRKVDAWTGRYRLGVADWPDAPYDPFFNANRPEDVAEAETIARSFVP
jgi:molybdopterin-guanine dinucleotide biosynthesis protein A